MIFLFSFVTLYPDALADTFASSRLLHPQSRLLNYSANICTHSISYYISVLDFPGRLNWRAYSKQQLLVDNWAPRGGAPHISANLDSNQLLSLSGEKELVSSLLLSHLLWHSVFFIAGISLLTSLDIKQTRNYAKEC